MKNRIKEIREKLNISQSELSRKIDITEKTIYNIEKGMDTKLSTAFKIKKALGEKYIEDIWKE